MHRGRLYWIVLLIVLTFLLGLLWPTYAWRMWRSGHYQFFPLVFLSVGFLIWGRLWEASRYRSIADSRVVVVLFAGLSVLIALANLFYSGFAGIIATIVAVGSVLYAAFGSTGLARLIGVLGLLIFAVPLPRTTDDSLVMKMQLLASGIASQILDGGGVIHFRQGAVLETMEGRFLAEEACSGIRSLFSSLFVVAVHGVARRHQVWRLLINVGQTVVWVVVGNSLRIAFVIAVADRAPWLASGYGHDLLGMGVFIFIVIMVASTDITFTRLMAGRLKVRLTRQSPERRPEDQIKNYFPEFPVREWGRTVIMTSLLLASMISLRAMEVRGWENMTPQVAGLDTLQSPEEADLDETVEGFHRTSFVHLQRGRNSFWAADSFIWEYERRGLSPIISIDRPWDHWHNLNVCYRNLGWETEARYSIAETDVTRSERLTRPYRHTEITMTRPGQYGYVIFSAFDKDGQHVLESQGQDLQTWMQWDQWLTRIKQAIGWTNLAEPAQSRNGLPISTVQVYAESALPWADDDLEMLRKLFYRARDQTIQRLK